MRSKESKEEIDNVIDFGKWVIPSKWEDVTLKQYEEIEKLFSEGQELFDIRKSLHILTNRTVDEVNSLPVDFIEIIMEKLLFMQEPIKEEKPTNKIVIDGETYFINIMEKLKFGEYVSADSVLKNGPAQLCSVIGYIVPQGW